MLNTHKFVLTFYISSAFIIVRLFRIQQQQCNKKNHSGLRESLQLLHLSIWFKNGCIYLLMNDLNKKKTGPRAGCGGLHGAQGYL